MKKIFITITLFALVFTSCERVDFGDTNQDPYAPTANNIDAMMRASMTSYAEQYGREGYSVATLYAQYQSQFSYANEQVYNQFKGSWYTNYVLVLNNLKAVYNTTDDVRGDTANMRAIAELVSVLAWKRITDTFGDVPYTEALQGGQNFTPAYTPQENIYADLIVRAKAARDMIDPAAFTPDADTDLYYGGDMDKWGKFANSLILALTIQISNTSAAAMAQTEFQAALADSHGLLESSADDMKFIPDLAGGMFNPISKQRPADYNLSKEFTAALYGQPAWGSGYYDDKNPTSTVGNSPDARISGFATSNANGLPYGYSNNDGVAGSAMSSFYGGEANASAPFILFTAAYTWLNRAEGALIYASGEDAETMLTNGIAASFATVTTMSGSAYTTPAAAAAKAVERTGDVAGSVTLAQVIGEEKWIALFPDGFAAWAEQRRTGFPALHAAPDAVNGGVIPHRMLYPTGESVSNPNGWAQGVSALSPADDKNTSTIWWE